MSYPEADKLHLQILYSGSLVQEYCLLNLFFFNYVGKNPSFLNKARGSCNWISLQGHSFCLGEVRLGSEFSPTRAFLSILYEGLVLDLVSDNLKLSGHRVSSREVSVQHFPQARSYRTWGCSLPRLELIRLGAKA